MILYLISIFLIFAANHKFVSGLSCRVFKNEIPKDVDYFVGIKIPKTLNNGKTGKGYVYKSNLDIAEKSDVNFHKWNYNENNIFGNYSSIIKETLFEVYANYTNYNYLMYNDYEPYGAEPLDKIRLKLEDYLSDAVEIPLGLNDKNKYGKSKGVLVWKGKRKNNYLRLGNAIWLIHSVKQFPNEFSTRSYQSDISSDASNFENGHNFMCLTIKFDHVETVIKYLISANVKFYSENSIDEILEDALNFFKPDKKSTFLKKAMRAMKQKVFLLDQAIIDTKNNKPIITISKNILAHRTEEKYVMPVFEKGPRVFKITEIQILNENIFKTKNNISPMSWNVQFDESKWGIMRTRDPHYDLFCLSDLERGFKSDHTSLIVCLISDTACSGFFASIKNFKKGL